MELVVRQISGLGNQLFQYAAGRYYEKRHLATMRVATDPLERAFSYGRLRPFLLPKLAARAPFAELKQQELLMLSSSRRHAPVAAALKRIHRVQVVEETVPQRHRFFEQLDIAPRTRTILLVGYWQTYKTAEALGESLREEFAFREEATGQTAEVLRQIRSTPNPVSVHVRRGDYTMAAEGNRVLPMHYYERAIKRLREKVPRPQLFVFSDDIEFARANLPEAADAVFVGHNDDASAHEDLRLMSACRHHVIANSSFSWWGAWFNACEDKRVIAPRQWMMTRGSYFPELLPPTWESLDVVP